ncbi:MAG: HAMP domain-containing histidine kinase [Leptospiraceae bacterium]|nr:HAMP domain-containing histidine kinase [Leptospiraceae bacterium]MCP5513751.1 HAMP domain-containing histidine kinase [Leptospiraceae bacterium]
MIHSTEQIVLKKHHDGIRKTFLARLLFLPIGILLFLFINGLEQSGLISISFLGTLLLLGFFLLNSNFIREDSKTLEMIGLVGVVFDLFLLFFVPFYTYVLQGGYDSIPIVFILKTDFILLAIFFMILNCLANSPKYLKILFYGILTFYFLILSFTFFDSRTIYTFNPMESSLGFELHPGILLAQIGLLISISLFVIRMTENTQSFIRETTEFQMKLFQQERKVFLGNLFSGLTHEIRNQLNPLTYLELIKSDLTEKEKQYLNYAMDCQERIGALIDEVRDISINKFSSLKTSEFDINDVISESIHLIKMDPDVKKENLHFTPKDSIIISIDKNKIIQVLLNLIRNSAHAIEGRKNGKIDIRSYVSNDFCVVEIEDNGVGIDPKLLEKIWEPYYTTKGENGTGLGLDISKRIVEQHQGSIDCESVLNKNTKFTIKLPISKKLT